MTTMTQSEPPKVLDRTLLFKRLDTALKQQVVWVYGVAGSGKTTLITSYLKRRQLRYTWCQLNKSHHDPAAFFHSLTVAASAVASKQESLPRWPREPDQASIAFCRHYFELLFQALPPKTVLVFDDVHKMADDLAWQSFMRYALANMPPDFKLLFISRQDELTPHWLTGIASQRMVMFGGRELALNLDEVKALARLYLKSNGGNWAPLIEHLHTLSQGWVAGILLLFEHINNGRTVPEAAAGLSQLFTRLISAVFDSLDEVTREFLLKTALWPSFTEEMALKLTSEASLLARLYHQNFFVERRSEIEATPVYQYHPLLREFLHAKAASSWSAAQLRENYRTAAQLLFDHGYLDEAFDLFGDSQSWDDMMWQIITNGPILFAQGRNSTLLRWCEAIPQQMANQNGWVCFWHAACHFMRRSGPEARKKFAQAFSLFEASADTLGMRAACCSAIAAIADEMADMTMMDPWIERLQEMTPEELDCLPLPTQIHIAWRDDNRKSVSRTPDGK